MRKVLYTLTVVFTILLLQLPASAKISSNVHVWSVSRAEMNHLNKVIQDSRARRWQSGILQSFRPKDQTLKKILKWNQYVSGSPALNFEDVTQFIRENPTWPQMAILRSNAEGVMNDNTNPDSIIRWFAMDSPLSIRQMRFRKPITSNGKRRLAEAMVKTYKKYNFDNNFIPTLIKEAWIEGNFSKEVEQEYLTTYKTIIDQNAIERRIDRLLTDRRTSDASRLARIVNHDYKKLFEARVAFIAGKKNVEALIKQVSPQLQNNSGLIYDRIKWRVDRGIDEGITELVQKLPYKIDYPEKLHVVRKESIKKLMSHKKYREAYLLAKFHSFTTENSEKYSEYEWLAGWLALRFQHDAGTALLHFRNVYNAGQTPITIARAAYWMGRSAEKMGNRSETSKWYNVAAKYPAVFYGQLGALKAGKRSPSFPSPSTVSKKDLVNYRGNELAKAAYIMLEIRENLLGKEFLKAAAESAKSPGERVLIAQMGIDRGNYGYSLNVAKHIYKVTGEVIMNALYPVFNLLSVNGAQIKNPPAEYILAIIRQESEFDTDAMSPAGARGLMQLMPATAQMVAHKTGLQYNKNRLTGDPRYNITLGSSYLASRLKLFDGSFILATASYNAGEGNVKKWLKTNGDPRRMGLEGAIDWIEMIPFPETNNYVQRVMENMQIYRIAISGKRYNNINTDRDITR